MRTEQPLGHVVASREAKLDEDTSVSLSSQTVMDLARDDGAWLGDAWLRGRRHTTSDDSDCEKDERDSNEAKRLAIDGIAQRPGLSQKLRFLSTIPWRFRLTIR